MCTGPLNVKGESQQLQTLEPLSYNLSVAEKWGSKSLDPHLHTSPTKNNVVYKVVYTHDSYVRTIVFPWN